MSSEIFVAVPSFNHAPYVEQCIRSIIAQTRPPNKLLVIDDGSSDASAAVIERVLGECSFDSELIVRENRGLCATLNEALDRSTGDYFAYLGSDDIWLPNFLEARCELLDARPSVVVGYGHAYFVDGDDKVFDSTAEHREQWASYPDGDARPMLLNGIAPVSSTVFYRRSALEIARWNEKSRLEDYEMYLKLTTLGEFAFDPRVLSAWRHHGYNTSGDRMLMLREVIEAQNRNIDILGIDADSLRAAQMRTKFRYARDQLQHGHKREALGLARESWRGASSAADLSKFLLRTLVPMKIVEMRRRARRERLKGTLTQPNKH